MSTITETAHLKPSIAVPIDELPKRRRLTPNEYMRMAETGILKPGERTELIRGEIVYMLPIGKRHRYLVSRIDTLLQRLLGDEEWTVFIQTTVEVDDSMPEPDLVVVKGNGSNFIEREATSEEIRLMIEVAETSLQYDRGEKLSLYAHAGITDYWIVNIPEQRIEVYCQPEKSAGGARYATHHTCQADDPATILFEGKLFSLTPSELFKPLAGK